MKKQNVKRNWLVIAIVCAALGTAAAASAGEVGVAVYKAVGWGHTYATCDWQHVYAKAEVYHYSGSTLCSVRDDDGDSGGYVTSYCNTSGAKGFGTYLRTHNTILCSDNSLLPYPTGSIVLGCGDDFSLRQDGGSCTTHRLGVRGFATKN